MSRGQNVRDSAGSDDAPALTREEMAMLVRAHSHDVRNQLNGLDLEVALLLESRLDSERHEAAARLRREFHRIDGMMRAFACKFIPETRSLMCVSDLCAQWRADAKSRLPDGAVSWNLQGGDLLVKVEAILFRSCLGELLALAVKSVMGQALVANCRTEANRAHFEVICRQASPKSVSADFLGQSIWSTLQKLVTRNRGVLEYETLTPTGAAVDGASAENPERSATAVQIVWRVSVAAGPSDSPELAN